ncbi:hypothetical protein ACFJGV_08230 [Cnuibacter sp. UC19_7]|uniref:hypothetical protein n=1 Tax=Cnuibacter sp. UC19_7 TaxID=3350166 RepID=UPI00366D7CBB
MNARIDDELEPFEDAESVDPEEADSIEEASDERDDEGDAVFGEDEDYLNDNLGYEQ